MILPPLVFPGVTYGRKRFYKIGPRTSETENAFESKNPIFWRQPMARSHKTLFLRFTRLNNKLECLEKVCNFHPCLLFIVKASAALLYVPALLSNNRGL